MSVTSTSLSSQEKQRNNLGGIVGDQIRDNAARYRRYDLLAHRRKGMMLRSIVCARFS